MMSLAILVRNVDALASMVLVCGNGPCVTRLAKQGILLTFNLADLTVTSRWKIRLCRSTRTEPNWRIQCNRSASGK